jgi:hypothetical protein
MVAILQRSGIDEAGNSRQYSPFLWGIDRGLRLLSGISLVRKGNIMDYLKENRDINRYYLVSTFYGPYALGTYLNLMSSYWVQPMDCVSCMKVAWFTEPCNQYV